LGEETFGVVGGDIYQESDYKSSLSVFGIANPEQRVPKINPKYLLNTVCCGKEKFGYFRAGSKFVANE